MCALHSGRSTACLAMGFQQRTYQLVCMFLQGVSSRIFYALPGLQGGQQRTRVTSGQSVKRQECGSSCVELPKQLARIQAAPPHSVA